MTTNPLSQREQEVLKLAVDGLTNDEIATHLRISRRTVETHVRTVFHKTGATRRTQLAALTQPTGTQPTGTQPTGNDHAAATPDGGVSPQVRDALAASPRWRHADLPGTAR